MGDYGHEFDYGHVGSWRLAPTSPVGAKWLPPRRFPFCMWAPNGWPHLLLWAPMDGPTEVSHIRINLSSRMWAPNGWPHLLLWAPTAGLTEVPIPINPSSVYAELPPLCPFCLPPRVFCPSWWGGGWRLNHCPLAHPASSVIYVSIHYI